MNGTQRLKASTPLQEKRRRRNAAIAREWAELTADPAQNRTAVIEHLMKKHGLYTRGSVYSIIKKTKP